MPPMGRQRLIVFKNSAMNVNKFLTVLLCFVLCMIVKGQVHEDLFDAHIGHEELLKNESSNKAGFVMTSSVLGKHVVDVKSLFREAGVVLGDSDVAIYGPDARVMYVKCGEESLTRIKNLCELSERSKPAYRALIKESGQITPPDAPDNPVLDVVLVSGDPIKIRTGEDAVTEITLTEGVVITGETQCEINISGLPYLMRRGFGENISCTISISDDDAPHEQDVKVNPDNSLKIKIMKLRLTENPRVQDRSLVEKQEMIGIIQNELKQAKK